jgi:hypothetical protein
VHTPRRIGRCRGGTLVHPLPFHEDELPADVSRSSSRSSLYIVASLRSLYCVTETGLCDRSSLGNNRGRLLGQGLGVISYAPTLVTFSDIPPDS